MRSIILGCVMAAIFSGAALADQVDNRQYRQGYRIYDGYASGELTHRETRKLLRGQSRVNRAEWRAERDGVVTRAERRKLDRLQDRQSRRIYNKKHNRRDYW